MSVKVHFSTYAAHTAHLAFVFNNILERAVYLLRKSQGYRAAVDAVNSPLTKSETFETFHEELHPEDETGS